MSRRNSDSDSDEEDDDNDDLDAWASVMEDSLEEKQPLEALAGHLELYSRIVQYAGATAKVAAVCVKMQTLVEQHLRTRCLQHLHVLGPRDLAERVDEAMVKKTRRRCTPQYKAIFKRLISNTRQLLKANLCTDSSSKKNNTTLQP